MFGGSHECSASGACVCAALASRARCLRHRSLRVHPSQSQDRHAVPAGACTQHCQKPRPKGGQIWQRHSASQRAATAVWRGRRGQSSSIEHEWIGTRVATLSLPPLMRPATAMLVATSTCAPASDASRATPLSDPSASEVRGQAPIVAQTNRAPTTVAPRGHTPLDGRSDYDHKLRRQRNAAAAAMPPPPLVPVPQVLRAKKAHPCRPMHRLEACIRDRRS